MTTATKEAAERRDTLKGARVLARETTKRAIAAARASQLEAEYREVPTRRSFVVAEAGRTLARAKRLLRDAAPRSVKRSTARPNAYIPVQNAAPGERTGMRCRGKHWPGQARALRNKAGRIVGTRQICKQCAHLMDKLKRAS